MPRVAKNLINAVLQKNIYEISMSSCSQNGFKISMLEYRTELQISPEAKPSIVQFRIVNDDKLTQLELNMIRDLFKNQLNNLVLFQIP